MWKNGKRDIDDQDVDTEEEGQKPPLKKRSKNTAPKGKSKRRHQESEPSGSKVSPRKKTKNAKSKARSQSVQDTSQQDNDAGSEEIVIADPSRQFNVPSRHWVFFNIL